MSLEWKTTPESNSGIFYNVQENVVDAIYQSGIEYQLADDLGQRSFHRNNHQRPGALYGIKASRNAKVRPVGEWSSSSMILLNGHHIEHWLNGEIVLDAELWTNGWYDKKNVSKWKDGPFYGEAKKGHIGLQDYGGLTIFRNIKIKKL